MGTLAATWITSIVYAIIIVFVGYLAAKFLSGTTRSLMEKRALDPSLASFTSNLINAAIITFTVVAALNRLGVQTTSLVAIIGAAGLAVGLALKDTLGNFAAGIMILIFRQFRSGDFIEAAGVAGVVESLGIFSTQLKTGDNKTIFVPNGKLIGDNIINYSMKGNRRLDLVIGVGYDADLVQAKQLLADLLAKDERVLREPEPTIGVLELADSSVNFAVRPWVNNSDYWGLYFDLLETIKLRFDEAGISIPFPQQDVHLHRVGDKG
jgi:small conductance mechanosensitive channel